MVAIRVSADVRAVQRDLRHVAVELVPSAAAQALNRTNKGLRTDITRAIASHYGIKPIKRVRRRVVIPRTPQFTASKRNLHAGGLLLFAFLPEYWTAGGKRGARAAQGPNKFVATMPNGYTGLWRRKPGRSRYSTGNLKIRERLIDITPQARRLCDDVLETRGGVRWVKEFDRALGNQLRRKVAKR